MNLGDILRSIANLISTEMKEKGLPLGDAGIQLHNVSFVESDNSTDTILMSIVNVEEEKTLRYSQTTTRRTGSNDSLPEVFTHNPVIFLNLFVLFSFHRGNDDKHHISWNLLGGLVRALQKKYIFTREDINLPDTQTKPPFEKLFSNFTRSVLNR